MNHVANAGIYLSNIKMVWKRQLAVEPDRLWDAIATKDGLSHWFMPTCRPSAKVGHIWA
ncbi:MAG: hypothetical protein QF672_14340 [SAR202 cluster bacterium]|nr:hypothetical protein [SAR202 cluster bacterium]